MEHREGGRQGPVSTFRFGDHDIRVVTLDGAPWFVAADVCRALYPDYDTSRGVSGYTGRLDPDERRVITLDPIGGKRGNPNVSVISESGLYKIVMRVHKNHTPDAKRFQDWVTDVVLPAIRKDGAYVAGEEKLASGELSGLVRGHDLGIFWPAV